MYITICSDVASEISEVIGLNDSKRSEICQIVKKNFLSYQKIREEIIKLINEYEQRIKSYDIQIDDLQKKKKEYRDHNFLESYLETLNEIKILLTVRQRQFQVLADLKDAMEMDM